MATSAHGTYLVQHMHLLPKIVNVTVSLLMIPTIPVNTEQGPHEDLASILRGLFSIAWYARDVIDGI